MTTTRIHVYNCIFFSLSFSSDYNLASMPFSCLTMLPFYFKSLYQTIEDVFICLFCESSGDRLIHVFGGQNESLKPPVCYSHSLVITNLFSYHLYVYLCYITSYEQWSYSSIVWSAICNIIPWAKVSSLCYTSSFIHVASENVCAMP